MGKDDLRVAIKPILKKLSDNLGNGFMDRYANGLSH